MSALNKVQLVTASKVSRIKTQTATLANPINFLSWALLIHALDGALRIIIITDFLLSVIILRVSREFNFYTHDLHFCFVILVSKAEKNKVRVRRCREKMSLRRLEDRRAYDREYRRLYRQKKKMELSNATQTGHAIQDNSCKPDNKITY